ncbi:MAG: DNA-3-methyladenine glycosylase 2 family protein [Selenomonadaceae bacterium]|nr:DNA-3-methyladenine glycosylase 2 family protein [Selenomonadaceae bacterium]
MTESIFEYGDKEIEYLKSKDKKLAAVIDRLGHIERKVDGDLFASVVHHIVGQQISMKAQETLWRRMNEGLGVISADTLLAAGRERVKSFGMAYRKADYILDFAAKVKSGEFDIEAAAAMNDREAIATLTALKGIGVWTAEMILLFSLGRKDVLSFGDLGIIRGIRMLYRHREVNKERFERYRRRFSPYGSVAAIYLWAVSGGAIPELTDPAESKK